MTTTQSTTSSPLPDGSGVPIRTRAEWEAWFRDSLFPRLEQMGASTDSEITGYEALRNGGLGYGVLDFRQTLTVAGQTATFECIATLRPDDPET